jgi:hypothetical protein
LLNASQVWDHNTKHNTSQVGKGGLPPLLNSK